MPTTINVRFKVRGYPAATWTANNEVLLERELGFETDGVPGEPIKFKFGDGVTAWNSLDYATPDLSLFLLASMLDTDGSFAANSDAKIPSQKAVKTYVDAAVTGLLDFKGSTNCSANPNYPAALKGDVYIVSVAGKIGGASGTDVAVGDMFIASADNAGGTQAAVGASWFVIEHNLPALGSMAVQNANAVAITGGTANLSQLGLDGIWYIFQTAGKLRFYAGGDFATLDVTDGWYSSIQRMDAMKKGIRTITATGSIATTDSTILCDATSGAITFNLPSAAQGIRSIYHIKKIDASANTVTIDPNGAETIDGAATKVLSAQWQSVTIQSNGAAWFILT